MNHDRIIDDLESRLKGFCDIVETKGTYKFKDENQLFKDYQDGTCYGEFDVIGIRNNTVFTIETKGRDLYANRKKAMYQLEKDKYYLSHICEDFKIHKFYAYSCDNKRGYTVEEIR
jgi:hypothetical protein